MIEPDGSRRTVSYSADSVSGFNAIVQKDPRFSVNSAINSNSQLVNTRVIPVDQYRQIQQELSPDLLRSRILERFVNRGQVRPNVRNIFSFQSPIF